ncbi:MAG: InlB B-repeat-containing protein, partial [Actinomycetota bacterium]|nr:InlB B-repeat-containing protein [Actinomycetota bacterium]
NFSDVEFVIVDGTLEISPAKLTITAIDQEYTYNGVDQGEGDTAYKDPAQIAKKVKVEGLQGGDTLTSVVLDGQGKDVDQYDLVPSSAAVGDATNNYEITYVKGRITINPVDIVLTSADDEKQYDGTPLTNNKVTVTEGAWIGDDGVTCDVFGSQTYVGSSYNKFTYEPSGETNLDNYSIETVFGTLKVTEPSDVSLVGTKTHEDKTYAVGETITWDISVTNVYDEPKDITLVEKDGIKLAKSEFAAVEPGEKVTTTAKHVVTKEDAEAGQVENTVTVKFSGGKDFDIPDKPAKVENPKNAHLAVAKETTSKAPEGGYALGDTITYRITVTNDGDVTISDIAIADELKGFAFDEGQKTEGIQLEPGKSVSVTGHYTVTEDDMAAGSVRNVATANGKDPDGGKPTIVPGTTDDPVAKTTFTITYDPNGGNWNGSTDNIVETYPYGTEITIHEAPTRDGYTFDYWKGSKYQPGDKYTVTEDHTFVAQWKVSATPAKQAKTAKSASPKTGDTFPAWALGAAGLGMLLLTAGVRLSRREKR